MYKNYRRSFANSCLKLGPHECLPKIVEWIHCDLSNTVEYYIAVKKQLSIVTWNSMDGFYFFEKKKPGTKEYGVYDCIYVKFKNRPNWFMAIEIRLPLARDNDCEGA